VKPKTECEILYLNQSSTKLWSKYVLGPYFWTFAKPFTEQKLWSKSNVSAQRNAQQNQFTFWNIN